MMIVAPGLYLIVLLMGMTLRSSTFFVFHCLFDGKCNFAVRINRKNLNLYFIVNLHKIIDVTYKFICDFRYVDQACLFFRKFHKSTKPGNSCNLSFYDAADL